MAPGRRRATAVVAALWLAAPALGCAGGDETPERLSREAGELVSVAPPAGWEPYVPPGLSDNQFVRDVDGVPVLFAGDARGGDRLRLFGTGVAWRSPELDGPAAVAAACDAAAPYADRAGFGGAVAAPDLAACRELPGDPDLRIGFVASFADGLIDVGDGSRTFGAGVLLDDDGTVTVVLSLAFGLDP